MDSTSGGPICSSSSMFGCRAPLTIFNAEAIRFASILR
jgi:hypothetical protein